MPNADTLLHPVAIAQVMVNFAAQLGADRDTCLLGTGLTESALLDSDTLVTRAQEMRLIENLILALPDEPALGFRLGLQYSLSNFGLWGFALRTSRTLREAAHRALRYLPLSTAYCQITPIDEAGGFGVTMDPDTIPSHLRQFLLERDMATGFNLLNELSLAGKLVVTLAFRGPPQDYADHIAQACAITPTYHSPNNAIMVQSDDADRPLPTYDAQLVRMLDDQCRLRLQRLQTASLGDQVRQQLHGPLGLVASLDEIARALALSPRSLRRKLDQEGTRFRALVEDERRQIALQFLRSSEMKLDELAIHLGYTDTASFTRAFRRWMGCSPGEYRQRQSDEG
ncbi:AraC family transcriptional regulator [Isoalcanivorax indicus]|uniref:AraC family transcriptional regulator n=1 Tax=Isoalcanivorax indicus TaxID=2202653 RepID=UPI000DBAB4BC|nr:AraC family transcriptional regulator [Isoalcanivorax indicus]